MERKHTHTSTAVKQRYIDKAYDKISVWIPKDDAAAFRAACESSGTPQAQVLKTAIKNYVDSIDSQPKV